MLTKYLIFREIYSGKMKTTLILKKLFLFSIGKKIKKLTKHTLVFKVMAELSEMHHDVTIKSDSFLKF